jgi:GTP-binding protein Era
VNPEPDAPEHRCGLVAIVGRPNVGKSTLLNSLVGQKLSITSRKAQTTRHRITGIRTRGRTQFVFVDTPGFQTREIGGRSALNRHLNRAVAAAIADVDVVLFVVEAGRFGPADERVLELLPRARTVILVANKLDAVNRRAELLPWLQQMQQRWPFAEYVPMSARSADDAERLLGIVEPHLPPRPWQYDPDALTDRSERFLAAELIREKLFRLTGDELPYGATVVIDSFSEEHPRAAKNARRPGGAQDGVLRRIGATIVVEREAHKGMVIGQGGERLKRIGSQARHDLERMFGGKVFLELWVKVRSGWADSEEHLRAFGYE